jgi:hypothetical protein
MKKIFAAFASLSLLVTLFFGGTTHADTSGLQASIKSSKPLEPALTLTNNTGQACKVANTPIGTVSITETTQNGQPITPTLIDVAFDQAMPDFLTERLYTLEPSQSLTIPLSVVETANGYALESVVWSQETGPYALTYPVAQDGPVAIQLNYSLPIQPTDGAPACPMATATTSNNGSSWLKIIFWSGGIFAAIAVLLLIIWLVRRKRPKAVAAIILLILGSILPYAPTAHAGISNTGSVQAQFDACMAILEEHNDITGEVLETINRGTNIVLRPNDDGINDTVDYREVDGDGNIYIDWDPNNTHDYAGSGGTSSPCDSLYHEMFHAHEMMWGLYEGDECGSSGIRVTEVNATRAQNVLRERLGLPQRSHYGDDPLPSGSCGEPPEPDPCEGDGCGETNGDPHMRTFDAMRYDFQAVGEFILAQDTTQDDFAIQVRQTAWPNSRQVAINESVVAKVANDTVEIAMRQNKPILLINSNETEIKNMDLPGGGKIIAGKRLTQIAWSDGSTLTARPIGSFGLHLVTDPAATRKNKLEGILGNYSGNSSDDLKIRGTDTIIKPEFDQLYPNFADSWRLSNETSLFTYQDSANTETYTDRNFPDAATSTDDLPGRAAAEALCLRQNITEPTVLENCILDVALTGRPEFASAAANGEAITSYADYGGATWKLTAKESNETPKASFTAKAGDKVFVEAFGSTLPDSCGAFALLAPGGRQLATGCLSAGTGFIDTHQLPVDGTYGIIANAGKRSAGEIYVRLITSKSETRSIALNGPTVTVNLNRPGSSAVFRFSGKVGQRIFLEMPSTTLPNQCGTLVLRDPSDTRLASGCITNGIGEINSSGIVLPKNGNYTFTIDPANTTTGEATVRLRD